MKIERIEGGELEAALPTLARLRIEVFAEYPYLYQGTESYEAAYLKNFANAKDGIVVAAVSETGDIVGCATGSAISDQHGAFAEPIRAKGYDLSSTFYFGESVLRRAFRGNGVGHDFFDAREAHALENGYDRACFCAVLRSDDHPKCPTGYMPLNGFWTKRGYYAVPGAVATFDWPEAINGPQISHAMQYWLREF